MDHDKSYNKSSNSPRKHVHMYIYIYMYQKPHSCILAYPSISYHFLSWISWQFPVVPNENQLLGCGASTPLGTWTASEPDCTLCIGWNSSNHLGSALSEGLGPGVKSQPIPSSAGGLMLTWLSMVDLRPHIHPPSITNGSKISHQAEASLDTNKTITRLIDGHCWTTLEWWVETSSTTKNWQILFDACPIALIPWQGHDSQWIPVSWIWNLVLFSHQSWADQQKLWWSILRPW